MPIVIQHQPVEAGEAAIRGLFQRLLDDSRAPG